MRGKLKSQSRTMCLYCFFIPCMKQARSFRELSLAEVALQEEPMVMGLPWVCTSAHMISQLLL